MRYIVDFSFIMLFLLGFPLTRRKCKSIIKIGHRRVSVGLSLGLGGLPEQNKIEKEEGYEV